MTRPLFSVCIPAYNRAGLLTSLLDSIFAQRFGDFEVLICEDGSPERAEIAAVVRRYQAAHGPRLRYEENEKNLGYDGNIRRLVQRSAGEYCVFMGNDDLLCPGALKAMADAIDRTPDTGVLVRSYASFDDDPARPKQTFRYFPEELVIRPGSRAIATAFRRSVVISGMVVHRDAAAALATDRYDGTLLYQLYLVGMVLASRSVVFTPEIIALRRDGSLPDFGNSEREKGKFTPRDQTPLSSIHFIRGMLAVARAIEEAHGLPVFARIRTDLGHYSYPLLSIQAHRPRLAFVRYAAGVLRLGFWRYPHFYAYFAALLVLGPARCDRLIDGIKRRVGHTPQFGIASEAGE